MSIAFDVTVNGQGLLDYGLYGQTVDGLGVVTYGLIWSCGSIWDVADENVTTTWSDCASSSNIEDCTE